MRAPAPSATLRRMSVTLAVEITSSPPLRGRVQLVDGHWEPFVGWMALAVLVGDAADTAGAPPPEPGEVPA